MRPDPPEEEKKSNIMKLLGKKLVIKNFKKPTGALGEAAMAQQKAKFLLKNFKNVGKSAAMEPNVFYGGAGGSS